MAEHEEISGGNPDGDRTLTIESIIAGGDGIARRADGCVVFVPRTAPGDVIEVEYTEQRPRWRRARVARLVTPGPDRRDPTCPHYTRCGGCQLQHLTYDAQLAAKATIVEDSLRRLGGVEPGKIDVAASPSEFAYRNRIALVARRSGDEVAVGYHAAEDPDDIVGIDGCPLAEEPINTVLASLQDTVHDIAAPGTPDLRLTLRCTADGRVGLAIESVRGRLNAPDDIVAIEGLDAMWWLDTKGNVIAGAGVELMAEQWDGYDIPLAGASFLQVNRGAAAVLDAYVIERCGAVEGKRIIDAYSGYGLRSLALARRGAVVSGIDVDRLSVRVAVQLAKQAGVKARFAAAPVERALASQLPADIVILNPPRRGAERRALQALAKRPPERLIYVSCDPATLARDIKLLGSKFRLAACRAFDLFPQTAHVETVATLTAQD